MAKDPAFLRQRFIRRYWSKWDCHNTYDRNFRPIGSFSAVYFFVSLNHRTHNKDIVYVGSTINLEQRYRIHKIPEKIQKAGLISILFFKEMDKGFYDFERKLIQKLKPKYNVQHKER